MAVKYQYAARRYCSNNDRGKKLHHEYFLVDVMFVTYLPFPQQLHGILLKILEQYQVFSDKSLGLGAYHLVYNPIPKEKVICKLIRETIPVW
jgi:hypothetical protein